MIASPSDVESERAVVRGTLSEWHTDLSREAQVLLLECAGDPSGTLMRIRYIGGTMIQSSTKNFVEENNPRSVAIWEGALEELESNGLLSSVGATGEVFKLTRRGYELADLLRSPGGGSSSRSEDFFPPRR